MARACVCCNLSEIRLALDEQIRAGVPYADLVREYSAYKLSSDQLERHGRNHVKITTVNSNDPAALLRGIVAQTSELINTCKLTGDARGALSALDSQLRAISQLMEHSRAEKESRIVASQPKALTVDDFDSIIAQVELANPHLDFTKQCFACGQFGAPRDVAKLGISPGHNPDSDSDTRTNTG